MNFVSRRKFLFFSIIMLILIFLLSLSAYAIYSNTKSLIEKEIGKSTMAISISVAEIIEQDIESYKKLSNLPSYYNDNYDVSYYNKMEKIFQGLKKSTDVRYLYTEKKISDAVTMYIFDGEPSNTEYFSPIGSTDVMDPYKLLAYATKKPNYSPVAHFPIWGDLISGYAPILDPSSGDVIGLVGTDISGNQINYIISYLRTIIILSFFAMLIILAYALYKIISMATTGIETDYLTGLFSKSYFEHSLKIQVKKSKDPNHTFSIMMLDVDNFKEINDVFGHHYGDIVLKNVSQMLKDQTRSFDICSRYGGDEFICLLVGAKKESSEMIAERVRRGVSELNLQNDENKKINVTVSIGIYEYDNSSNLENIIKCADIAMYKSKNSGKNMVSVF